MLGSRNTWLIPLIFSGLPLASAAEPDCYYGEGKYTFGTILCQAGMTMQCRRGEDGSPVWASLERECAVSAPEKALSTEASPSNSSEVYVSTETNSAVDGHLAIEILWADYGRDGRTCDAAPAVIERCDKETECEIAVHGNALCGDPYPGRVKLLSIYYACNDGSGSHLQPAVYAEDDSTVALHCSTLSKR